MQLELGLRPIATVGSGARATQDALLAELDEHLARARRDWRLLGKPIRVVVPSRSLRLHLAGVIARRLGPVVIGLRVQTLHGLALEVLEQAGDSVRPAGAMQRVLVHRLAAQESALAITLKRFERGFDVVADSVAQLLDAGLTTAQLPAALESVQDAPLPDNERHRVQAVLRVAAHTLDQLAELGLDPPSAVLQRATERVKQAGPRVLPGRMIRIHGFADATAVAADLLEAIVALPKARCTIDLPPDPAEPERLDVGGRHTERLRERMRLPPGPVPQVRGEPPQLDAFAAVADEGEALEVAHRVLALIVAGERPEGIGIVARHPQPFLVPLRRHLTALGVPFSGLQLQGPDTPAARWRGLVTLLDVREELATERWLALLALDPTARADLRLALRAAGAGRLRQAAALEPPTRDVPLPVRSGIDRDRAIRRRLAAPVLRGAIEGAQALLSWFQTLPRQAAPGRFTARLHLLLTQVLGHEEPPPGLVEALTTLAAYPADEVHIDEFRLLLREALAAVGSTPLGGRGGGVQVLSVREARARTFDHLFVMGLNRSNMLLRDPLLSDPVRTSLQTLLPELGLKRERLDEERYLFAQLLSAAPQVTVSWQTIDATGKPRAVSPLVERMRWSQVLPQATRARPAWDQDLTAPRNRAIGVALRSPRDILQGALVHAHHDAQPQGGPVPAAVVAAARVRVLEELDPGRLPEPVPHPWFGFVGPLDHRDDPRRAKLWISTAEGMARCPWRTFIERFLRVEPLPDPLASVPQADARLAGSLVHEVLERIAGDPLPNGPRDLGSVARAEPQPVSWPSAQALLRLARQEAHALLAREGVRLPGLAELMARRALPALKVVAREDFKRGPVGVLGVEVEGAVRIGAGEVWFRADRVDAHQGGVRMTDYKTGRPLSKSGNPSKRKDHHLADVRRGKNLQASAYAAAQGLDDATGRFLYLRPDQEPETRAAAVWSEDAEFRLALDDTLSTVLDAVEGGVFFPRLVDPHRDREPTTCRHCDVAEACLRGDSSHRARLRRYATARAEARTHGDASSDRFLDLWGLPARESDG